MDAAPPPVREEPPVRDWSLLPVDVLSLVFIRLGAIDVLMGAGLVCRSWLEAAKVPDVWRVVKMDNYKTVVWRYVDKFRRGMAKAAVDRSDGQLQVFAEKLFVTEEILKYILERSPSLTTLRLSLCRSTLFSARIANVIRASPLSKLRSLELDDVNITVDELTVVLENCPVLENLTLRDCDGLEVEDEHILRANFTRIKNLTYACYGDDFCGWDYWNENNI
ncbi:unnamed protein product [Alopecurus aequalis]